MPFALSFLVLAALAADPRLVSTTVEIDVADGVARVTATYHVEADGDVRFRLRRFEGQELTALAGTPELDERPGLMSFEASGEVTSGEITSGDITSGDITAIYELRGELDRLPLFVPDAPTDPAAEAVVLRLRGLGDDVSLEDGFPRFDRGAGGVLEARPANLPSFVRLPPPRGRLTGRRVAEIAAVVLLALGTAGWIVRMRRG